MNKYNQKHTSNSMSKNAPSRKPFNSTLSNYAGLDVHKESIAVAIATMDGSPIRYYGNIKNTPGAVEKMSQAINPDGEVFFLLGISS